MSTAIFYTSTSEVPTILSTETSASSTYQTAIRAKPSARYLLIFRAVGLLMSFLYHVIFLCPFWSSISVSKAYHRTLECVSSKRFTLNISPGYILLSEHKTNIKAIAAVEILKPKQGPFLQAWYTKPIPKAFSSYKNEICWNFLQSMNKWRVALHFGYRHDV